MPEIRASSDGITFEMAPPGARPGEHLVIRCDAKGDVWISIRSNV
jgi:hypothetical protein